MEQGPIKLHSCLPVNVSYSEEECVAPCRNYTYGQRWPAAIPSLTSEFPLIKSEPSEPRHKKPCYSVGLIFELGPSPQSLPVAGFLARHICYYGSPVCFWASCSHFFSLCVLYVPFSLSSSPLTLHLVIRLSTLSISPLLRSVTSFLWLAWFPISHPVSLDLFIFFSLFIFLQCDQVQVIPIPSVCIIIFHLSLSCITVTSSFCLLCFIILAACGCWLRGDLSLLSGENLQCYILIIIQRSRLSFVTPSHHWYKEEEPIHYMIVSLSLFYSSIRCQEQNSRLIFLLNQIHWILLYPYIICLDQQMDKTQLKALIKFSVTLWLHTQYSENCCPLERVWMTYLLT